MPEDQVRTAEVVGSLCMATDLGMGLPFGHGVGSTVVAMRLAEKLGVDHATAVQTYYGCLLFYAGCTADADLQAELFPDGLVEHWTAVMFASQRQSMSGVFRALGSGGRGPVSRSARGLAKLPRAMRGYKLHTEALCEVAEMLAAGVGLPPDVSAQFRTMTERWDGHGPLERAAGTGLPLAIRIVHVARDASFHGSLRGPDAAVEVVRARAGGAFDPSVAAALSADMLDPSVDWSRAMAAEPTPHLSLRGSEVDDALGACAAFADLADVVGHSSAVAELVEQASVRMGLPDAEVSLVRRAALLHDLGKVAVPFRIWHHGAVSPDDREKVRLHPYYTERALAGSTHLAGLAHVAARHHEQLDGKGYHRGLSASELDRPSRLLAAADAFRTAVEPRPGQPVVTGTEAVDVLRRAGSAGTLDRDAVAAVLEVAGHRVERLARPDGLTPREEQTLALLAQGLATKQIGRTLGVTAKTADHYVQQVYAKIGVSTRAAAAVYAMRHGLATGTPREFSR